MSRGFSTLELLIAMLILTSTLAAVTLLAFGIPQALENGRIQEEAINQADYLLQEELHIGMRSFSGVTSLATTSSNGFDSGLVSTLLPDGITKALVSTVHWLNSEGIAEYLTLNSQVTDFENISTTGACDSVLIGDWSHPESTLLTMTPVSLLPSTFLANPYPITSLAVSTSTLVAGVSSSTTRTDPTLFIFSTASSTHPTYIGSIDTATSTKYGENALATNGSLIYTASGYPSNFTTCSTGPTCSQIQIVDASIAAAPVVESYFQLATSSAPYATGSGGQSTAKSLFYADGLLYVGLQKTGAASGGDEFNIVDVHNPRAAVWIGGYSVGRSVNQIQVRNGFAYLATDDPARELIVLDVHTPTNPILTGSYDAPGSSIFGYGESVAVSSTSATTTVFLGRSFTYNGPGMTVLSATTSITALSSTTENTTVSGIILQGFLAFLLTSSQLEFWNIADLMHPIAYGRPLQLPASSAAVVGGLACRHSTFYVASTDPSHKGYLTVVTGS